VVVPVGSKSSPLATARHPLPAADRLGAFRAVIAAYYWACEHSRMPTRAETDRLRAPSSRRASRSTRSFHSTLFSTDCWGSGTSHGAPLRGTGRPRVFSL